MEKPVIEKSAVSSMVYSLSESSLTRVIALLNSSWVDTRMTVESAAAVDIGTKQNIMTSVRIRMAVLFFIYTPGSCCVAFLKLRSTRGSSG